MFYKNLGKTNIRIPAIGQGCMGIGGYLTRNFADVDQNVQLLKLGIELGMTMFDTAEGYGGGLSEELVGKAVQGVRERVQISTKVSPEHLSYQGVIAAAEGSLKRLKADYIDLYQVHWPNNTIPVGETMRAMKRLLREGKIRSVGLSNFSVREVQEAANFLDPYSIDSLQVEYNLFDRSIEAYLLPYCESNGILTIAYSPLDQGRVKSTNANGREFEKIAERYNRTPAQIVLNWLISHPTVVAIPKASTEQHVRDNAAAADFQLSDIDRTRVNELFKVNCSQIPTDRIKVSTEGEGRRKVYQNIEAAVKNPMGFVPGPAELAKSIVHGDPIKPVRLVPTKDRSGKYDYDLIEGRIRYWAWVIAHNDKTPIPAFIRSV